MKKGLLALCGPVSGGHKYKVSNSLKTVEGGMLMRKKNREVTNPADIFSIMQACDRAVLAFNAEPAPYLLPVNMGSTFTEDGFTLYFHGATEGRK